MVGSKLDLVALLGRAVRHRHDTRIVDQDVEARFAAFECRGCVGNRREGGEVEGEEDDFARIGHRRLDRGDGIAGFGLGARREVDARGVVGREICNRLLAQARVAWPGVLGS